jgi:hypothetical protein
MDSCVCTATAQIASHGGVNVGVAGVFVVAQQSGSAHELARLAVAALWHLVLDPGFLQSVVATQAFNGADARASHVAHLGLA